VCLMHRLRLCAVIALLVGVLRSNHLPAQSAFLAPTPQMGWNSWDSYGTTVREEQVKANADVMTSDLARYGWKYIVLDISGTSQMCKDTSTSRARQRRIRSKSRVDRASISAQSAAIRAYGTRPIWDGMTVSGLSSLPMPVSSTDCPIYGRNPSLTTAHAQSPVTVITTVRSLLRTSHSR
jgi:hypothetical protein